MATRAIKCLGRTGVYLVCMEVEPPDPDFFRKFCFQKGFPSGSVVKNLPASLGHEGLIPGLGRSPGQENDNPL